VDPFIIKEKGRTRQKESSGCGTYGEVERPGNLGGHAHGQGLIPQRGLLRQLGLVGVLHLLVLSDAWLCSGGTVVRGKGRPEE